MLLTNLLDLQATQIEQLLATLASEKSALEQRDILELEKISSSKQTLITAIAETDMLITQHADYNTSSDTLSAKKADLETQLKQCQLQNEVNGKLIELNLRHSRRLTDTIVKSRSSNNITYDKLGRTRGTFSTLGMRFKS